MIARPSSLLSRSCYWSKLMRASKNLLLSSDFISITEVRKNKNIKININKKNLQLWEESNLRYLIESL